MMARTHGADAKFTAINIGVVNIKYSWGAEDGAPGPGPGRAAVLVAVNVIF